jgi:putative ABC transport system permease protein
MLSDLLYRLRALFQRNTVEGELDEELRFHTERQVQARMKSGLTREEAMRRARMDFGGLDQVKEECREARGVSAFEVAAQDLRYAIRMLVKSPGFAMVAILSLALGVGANTAVFSVVHAVLLRPLPFPEPNRLVLVEWQYGLDSARPNLSIPQMDFLKEHSTAFSSMAGYRGAGETNLVVGADREWIKSMTVTADFFRTLDVALLVGREFNSEETHTSGPRAVILSNQLWRRTFGADPEVLGRAVRLDDATYTVVGVLPAGFWFPENADAFVALRPNGGLGDTGTNTRVIARLKTGLDLRQGQAEMATVFENYRRAGISSPELGDRGPVLVRYQDFLVGDVKLNLLLLFGAVGLLLFIACSNLGSLLLARLASRQKEIALRLALGSSRARLLGQFVVENLLLSVLGGLAGLFGAYWLLRGLVALIPFELPASAPIRLDVPVLLFAMAIAFATGLVFSLAPFLSSARLDVNAALKASQRSAGGADGARQRTRSMLVIGEVALSVTLLIVAGLLIESLYRLHQEHLGFNPEGVVTFETPLAADKRQSGAQVLAFQRNLLDRLQGLPGVRSVAVINALPLIGMNNFPTQHAGHPEHSIGGMEYRLVTPAFFEAMGISLRRGRFFSATDTAAAPPVVLINETVAGAWWPNSNPIGDRVVVGRYKLKEFPEIKDAPREIVGVVADTKAVTLTDPPRPMIYIPAAQAPENITLSVGRGMAWVVRADLSARLADEIRRTVAEIDPGQRVLRMQPMTEVVASTTADSRFDAWLFGSFAGVALLLTAIGVYGLLSFSVAQRRQEIGTRMALGASRGNILTMVLRQGFALTLIGLVLGLGGALVVARSLSSLLFGVRPNDPVSFATVSLLLLGVGLVASYVPARRATRLDPLVALRYE